MADKGGVVGIYFMPFLGDNGTPWATEAMVLDHIDHALNVCGEDHVGIGTDGPARALAYGIRRRKGIVSLTGRDEKQAGPLAEKLGHRGILRPGGIEGGGHRVGSVGSEKKRDAVLRGSPGKTSVLNCRSQAALRQA